MLTIGNGSPVPVGYEPRVPRAFRECRSAGASYSQTMAALAIGARALHGDDLPIHLALLIGPQEDPAVTGPEPLAQTLQEHEALNAPLSRYATARGSLGLDHAGALAYADGPLRGRFLDHWGGPYRLRHRDPDGRLQTSSFAADRHRMVFAHHSWDREKNYRVAVAMDAQTDRLGRDRNGHGVRTWAYLVPDDGDEF